MNLGASLYEAMYLDRIMAAGRGARVPMRDEWSHLHEKWEERGVALEMFGEAMIDPDGLRRWVDRRRLAALKSAQTVLDYRGEDSIPTY